jgi:hypothetical protein
MKTLVEGITGHGSVRSIVRSGIEYDESGSDPVKHYIQNAGFRQREVAGVM